MSIFNKVQEFRKKINSYNDIKAFIMLRPNESTFNQYIDEHLSKTTSDITKFELLDYSRYAFPHNSELFTTILKSIDLNSKERKQEMIGIESSGYVYDQHLMGVSIIPLILNTVIYPSQPNQQDVMDAHTEKLSSIAIEHFTEKGIDLRKLPIMPYEDAFYMNRGNFTEVPNEEDPQIVVSSEFKLFKNKYETQIKNSVILQKNQKMKV